MHTPIAIKRIHAPAEADDGVRVLVDRLWPRGVRKADARLDFWLKEVAPSPALRRWFNHDPAHWDEFRRRYLTELAGKAHGHHTALLLDLCTDPPVTLLYAARNPDCNHALVLREFLRAELATMGERASAPCTLAEQSHRFGLDPGTGSS